MDISSMMITADPVRSMNLRKAAISNEPSCRQQTMPDERIAVMIGEKPNKDHPLSQLALARRLLLR